MKAKRDAARLSWAPQTDCLELTLGDVLEECGVAHAAADTESGIDRIQMEGQKWIFFGAAEKLSGSATFYLI